MAQPNDTQTTDTTGCPSAKDLLDHVIKQIADFDAMKLPELKTDLTAFVKNEDDLEKEYSKQYPGLREKWCAQQRSIETLYAAIKCAFPGADWKQII
jgi:hypothetical protein